MDDLQRLVGLIAGEDRAKIGVCHAADQNFAKHLAIVGRDIEIAAVIELVGMQTGPLAIDLAAIDIAADDKHNITVAVVGAAAGILLKGTTEFTHYHNCKALCVVGAIGIAQVGHERGETTGYGAKLAGKVAGATITLRLMGIPAAQINGGHLEAQLQFDLESLPYTSRTSEEHSMQ